MFDDLAEGVDKLMDIAVRYRDVIFDIERFYVFYIQIGRGRGVLDYTLAFKAWVASYGLSAVDCMVITKQLYQSFCDGNLFAPEPDVPKFCPNDGKDLQVIIDKWKVERHDREVRQANNYRHDHDDLDDVSVRTLSEGDEFTDEEEESSEAMGDGYDWFDEFKEMELHPESFSESLSWLKETTKRVFSAPFANCLREAVLGMFSMKWFSKDMTKYVVQNFGKLPKISLFEWLDKLFDAIVCLFKIGESYLRGDPISSFFPC
jgi:hypothetical protein